jgi:hypothetical protein
MRVCREIYESHEMREIREIREGHDVKSSKRFEVVVSVMVTRLNVKSLRIEQMVQHENGLPIARSSVTAGTTQVRACTRRLVHKHEVHQTKDESYMP